MPDGTEKQVNPFTGTEVWVIPGRKSRPLFTHKKEAAKPIRSDYFEHCHFCPLNYFTTPPEKSRIVLNDGKYEIRDRIAPIQIKTEYAEFRRIPNLFEIVTFDYWKKNYGYGLSPKNRFWKKRYLDFLDGRDHVLSMIDLKLRYSELPEKQIEKMPADEKLSLADGFFGGTHELIISGKHFTDGAKYDDQLASSGELSAEQHFQYFRLTLYAMDDIHENNPHVQYISVYQNWLREAGASFEHLHKQIVGLDEWGISIEQQLELAEKNPNIYNECSVNYAIKNNHIICENDYAIAMVDIGHRYPTVAVFSKSRHCRPHEHTEEELRGFSDVVHAIHAATGSHVSCNEEWFYMPRDAMIKMPWHVMIKWRINIPAGFEGGTKIYVNPMYPEEMREQLLPRLYNLRDEAKIAKMAIGKECLKELNPLRYNDSEHL